MTAQELIVALEDRPGALANLAEVLGRAGINIDGVCGVPSVTTATVHLLVNDVGAARRALEAAAIRVQSERPVLVMEVEDRPGVLGQICRRLADAGVNITLAYLATRTRLVLGVDDIDKAAKVMEA